MTETVRCIKETRHKRVHTFTYMKDKYRHNSCLEIEFRVVIGCAGVVGIE
jgi:hypothetical protein